MTPEDIKGLPLLCSSRPEVQRLLAKWSGSPFEQLNVVGNFNLIFNVLPLVDHKIGAALTVEGAISDRKLEESVFIPLYPTVKTNCVLVWKKRLQTPAVQELINRFKYAFQL
jgi:DNA-binding transcriptional LysR family regulator